MDYRMITLFGILIPFLGTTVGSSLVFFCRKTINLKVQKMFLGFAAGVMLAASIWSLIIPSIELAENQNVISWLPVTIGIILGFVFLFVIEIYIDKFSIVSNLKNNMLEFAIILHNIPEGMAIGVVFASALNMGEWAGFISAISVAVGIAIQNIPEGMAISFPAQSKGIKRIKAFSYGVLSGIVEPICAIITILISDIISIMLPILLAFAAGSMLYVVIKELIPQLQDINLPDTRSIRSYYGIFDYDDFRYYIRIDCKMKFEI